MKTNREGAKVAKADAKKFSWILFLRVCLRALRAFAVAFDSISVNNPFPMHSTPTIPVVVR